MDAYIREHLIRVDLLNINQLLFDVFFQEKKVFHIY